MANFGNPAYSAATGNAAGMAVLATAGVGLAHAIGDGIAAAARARYERRYDDALSAATSHADTMELLARTSMQMVAELEAEVARLRAACRQRQEVIDVLKARRA
ncbi:hypothetical protein AMC90_CH02880 [Rhizobium phaseoli]|uniref:hypothetical protein n=1 Tax=Rhizobium phaseoli TaxID=396 RepID=UPI0007EB2075|nr:hypothetical protein [Rhizobium phaseoli]ANL28679.1 hypothetical protein AMC90_CH02880 [Rhizobium phaseoli]ANM05007.1 hypothetical protein AMC78_CH02930 [Rhizobium phaseoli]